MSFVSPIPQTEPPLDCPICPRLVAFREALRVEYPGWWNAPVPTFGDPDAWLVVIGLAPGKHGANRTGRPFTGDYAGELLFETLGRFGMASGTYQAQPDDGFQLNGVAICNSVKCLPPENKPTPQEIANCRPFLVSQVNALIQGQVFVALGQIAHQSAVRTFGGRLSEYKFAHLAEHRMPGGEVLIDSYHCSRYNQNTGRLTRAMFEAVFERALELRDRAKAQPQW